MMRSGSAENLVPERNGSIIFDDFANHGQAGATPSVTGLNCAAVPDNDGRVLPPAKEDYGFKNRLLSQRQMTPRPCLHLS